MTILVTGARGFIGKRLLQHFQRSAVDVIGSGRAAAPDADILWIRHTLGAGTPLPLPDHVDVIVHLAFAHPSEGVDDATVQRVNVDGTREVVTAAHAAGVQRVVVASSGAVYGFGDRPFREGDPPQPDDMYGRSKLEAENVARSLNDGPTVHVLRVFFPYGPGQRGRLVARLVDRVLGGEPVTIHPGGRPRLNPIHVDDVVAVLSRVARRGGPEVMNVAGTEVTDVAALADRIGRIASRTVSLVEGLPPTSDLVADIGVMVDRFGFHPSHGLEAGLREVVAERTLEGTA